MDAGRSPGDEILVTNGVYQVGGLALYGSNRVAVTKRLTVRSVNGPGVTVIRGAGPMGPAAVRCVYLANGAVLSGFTLTNGATDSHASGGGGVWCESASAVVSNCCGGQLRLRYGGGAYRGTLNNCTLASNSAQYGGGTYGTLSNCTLTGNSAATAGGLVAIWAASSWLDPDTTARLTANLASQFRRRGIFRAADQLHCSITTPRRIAQLDCERLNHCCTTPLPGGTGNFTNAPLFVDQAGGDLRLQTNSPCINAGLNTYASGDTDMDGNPRISGGTVDVGAYEFQSPASIISYAWLQSYGLPTDGSADTVDADSDRMNTWQEWQAGTDPTNAASVLAVQSSVIVPGGVTLTWPSVTSRTYSVQRATSLADQPAFSPLRTNIPGLAGTTSFTDTNPPAAAPAFYRIGVQP